MQQIIILQCFKGNPASELYERMGFVKDGIRKNYYTDPVEDAVLMTKK